MGLDIGYHLYKKQPVDERSEFTEFEGFEPSWVCGRCEVNYSWGELFKHSDSKETTPVFQEGLADKRFVEGDYVEDFELVKFEDFKRIVQNEIDHTFEQGREEKKSLLESIRRKEEQKKELRNLQKSCTEDEEFAFEKWGDEIRDLDSDIAELKDCLDSYDDEDYDWTHARAVQNLLNEMEKKLEEDEYYVVPFFSY